MPTTTECVESEQQLEFMRACGCTDAQGFLLGRPARADSIAGVDIKSAR